MSQLKHYKQDPYSPEMVEKSTQTCCVSSTGRRKLRWEDKAEAAAHALEIGGKYYPCIFHRGTYHITSKAATGVTATGPRVLKGDTGVRIAKLAAKLDDTLDELQEISETVERLPFEELKACSVELLERRCFRRNTARQILVELEVLKELYAQN
jgi:hypothetical protein